MHDMHIITNTSNEESGWRAQGCIGLGLSSSFAMGSLYLRNMDGMDLALASIDTHISNFPSFDMSLALRLYPPRLHVMSQTPKSSTQTECPRVCASTP